MGRDESDSLCGARHAARSRAAVRGSAPAHACRGRAGTTAVDSALSGDALILTKDAIPGRPALRHENGTVLSPARIGVTLPEALVDVRPGEAIWFDDGRIGGVIRNVCPTHLEVAITHANTTGLTLGADKGINLPDSLLRVPPLTAKDLDDLRFIASHADIVGFSFVRTAEDVRALQAHLHALDRPGLPLILKIETRRAFEHLPTLLMAVMHSAAAGVMIARGDLAVECGFERLAEVQEEILWLAEASHMPVIWATQVLETLAKEGIPSRAEITDAAMAERAECVMLNKGPAFSTRRGPWRRSSRACRRTIGRRGSCCASPVSPAGSSAAVFDSRPGRPRGPSERDTDRQHERRFAVVRDEHVGGRVDSLERHVHERASLDIPLGGIRARPLRHHSPRSQSSGAIAASDQWYAKLSSDVLANTYSPSR